jgi:Flp pilus assembly CpaE family ATPase
VPLVLLATAIIDETWRQAGTVIPVEASPDTIREALLTTIRGGSFQPNPTQARLSETAAPAPDKSHPAQTLTVLAVASGHGSPGRTTIALNLAVALGAVAPTLLVDADLGGASVAAALDLDPTRNLAMLAHAAPETPRDWERGFAQETQPLVARSPQGAVLCGIPKPELRANVTARFFERLLAEARRRYRYVVVDVGTDLLGADTSLHRLTLGLADQILLVSTADLIGLWHARSSMALLRSQLGIAPGAVVLLLNRYDRRYHHGRGEIEWTLGVSAGAVIPEDHARAQRAVAAQLPLILDRQSRAGRAVLELAERIHGGQVVLPPEAPKSPRRWPWTSWHVPHLRWPHRRSGAPVRPLGKDGSSHVSIG